MRYNIDTIPKSYQRLFGNPPKDIETRKSNLPETTRQNRGEYEQWTSNVWNNWILNVSEQDKIRYRMQDLQEKYN